jgi:phosphinothricin acetyltransferase
VGYAYASPWAGRCSYRFSVETTIYLNVKAKGRGIGSELYSELIKKLKALNYHVIIGSITLPNEASVALHEKFGFEKVAHYKEIGFKYNRWLDVGY